MTVLDVLFVAIAGTVAVVAGRYLVSFALTTVDRLDDSDDADSLARAETSLRGGTWIGMLERLAVFAAVLTGWPEGIAVVLAVKSLARYPELQARDTPAAAERFIIGTFVSVLFALACAGVARSLIR